MEAIVARRLAEMKPCEKNSTRPNKSLFTGDIQTEVLPVGTNLPKFEPYDGTTDPVDHLVQFENTMLLHNFSDAMYCKAFATTLKSTARTWFHQLPSSSIATFSQLAEKFNNHFMASRPPEKDASYLMTLKQGANEHLREYLTRFTKAMYEIPTVNTAVAIEAFKQGVRHRSAFHLSISKQKITNFDQIKQKAEKYIR